MLVVASLTWQLFQYKVLLLCTLQLFKLIVSWGDPTFTQNGRCLLEGVNSIAVKIFLNHFTSW